MQQTWKSDGWFGPWRWKRTATSTNSGIAIPDANAMNFRTCYDLETFIVCTRFSFETGWVGFSSRQFHWKLTSPTQHCMARPCTLQCDSVWRSLNWNFWEPQWQEAQEQNNNVEMVDVIFVFRHLAVPRDHHANDVKNQKQHVNRWPKSSRPTIIQLGQQ